MKGKVGFVLGAALGYVLGTRAGRARYEQIKRGAISVWETPLVQQGVSTVKDAVGDRVDDVKAAAGRAARSMFEAATQPRGDAKRPDAAKSSGQRPASEQSDASASGGTATQTAGAAKSGTGGSAKSGTGADAAEEASA